VREQLECIRLLVAHGARVNERTDLGGTALMSAAWFGNREAVDELLRLGADSACRDYRGKTASVLASEKGYDELAKLLQDNAES
jgi:uncharacterized protein